jgi:allantoinase
VIVRGGEVLMEGAAGTARVDLGVRGGVVAAVGAAIEAEPGEEILDAGGLLVLPGAVDPHVHFNDPGFTEREDFLSGTSSAASGGVTTVIDMPCTSVPAVTTLANLLRKEGAVAGKAVVDYGFFGGVPAQSMGPELPATLAELAPEVLGLKVYLLSGMAEFGSLGPWELEQVFRASALLGLPVLVHAEDAAYVASATGRARKAGDSPRHYYGSRPETAEVLAVEAAIALAAAAGGDLHVVHVGAADAADLVLRARSGELSRGRVTSETAPHYLAFDLLDFERIGSALKINPPVKSPGNRERLWHLLSSGAIDFVASDHAPCPPAGKRTGSIWTDYAGIPGCPTLLPYLYAEGFRAGRLTLPRLAEVCALAAARRYGIAGRKGSIAVGKDADLVLLDPAAETVVRGECSPSRGKITPFEGMRLRGRIERTLVRGRVVWDAGRGLVAEPGWGKRLRRGGR